jgi:hypothetical protein
MAIRREGVSNGTDIFALQGWTRDNERNFSTVNLKPLGSKERRIIMKVHKYFSAALLAGALSLTPKLILADDDMLTDFHAMDAQEQNGDLMYNNAALESSLDDGSYDLALASCFVTNVVEEDTGEITAVYSICEAPADMDVG